MCNNLQEFISDDEVQIGDIPVRVLVHFFSRFGILQS